MQRPNAKELPARINNSPPTSRRFFLRVKNRQFKQTPCLKSKSLNEKYLRTKETVCPTIIANKGAQTFRFNRKTEIWHRLIRSSNRRHASPYKWRRKMWHINNQLLKQRPTKSKANVSWRNAYRNKKVKVISQ